MLKAGSLIYPCHILLIQALLRLKWSWRESNPQPTVCKTVVLANWNYNPIVQGTGLHYLLNRKIVKINLLYVPFSLYKYYNKNFIKSQVCLKGVEPLALRTLTACVYQFHHRHIKVTDGARTHIIQNHNLMHSQFCHSHNGGSRT